MSADDMPARTVRVTATSPARAVASRFDIRTARCDATRAVIIVSGDLDHSRAPLLAQVIDTHLRAGRRFLRLNVGRLRHLDDAGLEVIAQTHERLLANRGTLILTTVREPIESVLRGAVPTSPLLLLSATAEENAL